MKHSIASIASMLRIGCLALPVLLSACVSVADPEYRATEVSLYEARRAATVPCQNDAHCDAAWRRTERYLALNSATPVVLFDATAIKTRTAKIWGSPYFFALRGLEDDGARTIRIRGMCRGMYLSDGRPGWLYRSCAAEIARVENGFRAFVDSDSDAAQR